ncbi:uncharacterized protein [Oscarella lobularis]|uniref:uncharacterized protein n=1 Tax=Oscarella lobularis TaxID=121494 RepID=UPI003313FFC9
MADKMVDTTSTRTIGLYLFILLAGATSDVQYFVDPSNGADSNPGTMERPFQSLQKAQDAVRTAKNSSGGVNVMLRKGNYDFTATPLTLTSEDSGSEKSPIRYGAYNGEIVNFLAGKLIPSSVFEAASEIGPNVYKANLKSLNMTNYGNLTSGELGTCSNEKMELFYNDEPMILARHPNILSSGMWQWMSVEKVINPTTIQFNCSGAENWKNVSTLWLHGYWKFDWADNYVHVMKFDVNNCTAQIDPATPFLYNAMAKARFYALNLIDFLDSPSEYYINRDEGVLYFYPPTPLQSGQAYVSVGKSVLSVSDLSYLTFDSLNVRYARGTALSFSNVSHVHLNGLDISDNGETSLSISGLNNIINNITVRGNGCGGIHVSGGDQKSLSPGNNTMRNCRVTHWGRWKRTYQPALGWSGVGNTYTENYFSGGPHAAILGGGNNCVFSYNHVDHVCYEVSDSGAFYTGRNWIDRGNVIANNTFSNITWDETIVLGSPSIQAIYLDDQMSGYSIYNNMFVNCHCGSFIGGGRRNQVFNNTYINCTLDVHIDDRGLTWQKDDCKPGGTFEQQLKGVNYQEPPWSTQYPELVHIFDDHPCVPVYNVVENNTYCNHGTSKFIDASDAQVKGWMDSVENNVQKC